MNIKCLGLLAIAAFASGCAFTPQAVVIAPQLTTGPSQLGAGAAVSINVVDERPKKTLGTRGVSGVGAELTIEGDLANIVYKAIAEGLERQGYRTSAGPANTGGRELRAEIRNLDYIVIRGFFEGTLRIDFGIKAICIQGTVRPYEQMHHGEHVTGVQVVQTADANNIYVSQVVSDGVNSLLQDQQLLACLAGRPR